LINLALGLPTETNTEIVISFVKIPHSLNALALSRRVQIVLEACPPGGNSFDNNFVSRTTRQWRLGILIHYFSVAEQERHMGSWNGECLYVDVCSEGSRTILEHV
jgi:hypothetical protein